jgi:hypothetical protein
VIIFNEALLHNGRPNPSNKTRQTIIMNLGRNWAGTVGGVRAAAQDADGGDAESARDSVQRRSRVETRKRRRHDAGG